MVNAFVGGMGAGLNQRIETVDVGSIKTAPAAVYEQIVIMPSRHASRSYRIQIFRPPAPPPPQGYPVFYVTDGAMGFRQAADQMLSRGLVDLRPALIVGIAHPSNDVFDFIRQRTWDLTPDRPRGRFRAEFASWAKFGGYGEDDTGGAEQFYRFLVEELRPWLADIAPIDPADQALYGHSLGGLFGLYVMFNHLHAFQTYALSSPTLVWNDGAVLSAEAAFSAAIVQGQIAPRLLLMRGGTEDNQTMAALARRLQTLQGRERFVVEKIVFRGENHMSVTPASLSRALTFAYSHLDPLPEIED